MDKASAPCEPGHRLTDSSVNRLYVDLAQYPYPARPARPERFSVEPERPHFTDVESAIRTYRQHSE